MCNYKPRLSFLQKVKLKHYTKQRLNGKPIAYITNSKEFYGREFYVNKNTLIPRPETEQIVNKALSIEKNPKSILDIGTGSGCLAVTLKKEFPKASLTAIDISSKALIVARKNAKHHNAKINFLKSDYLSKVAPKTSFDLIVTNPPYIEKNNTNLVSPETKKYEPHQALFADQKGLGAFQEIFKQIQQKNIQFHHLIGEFGFGQKPALELLLQQNFKGCSFEFFDDLNQIPRIFLITKHGT